MLKETHPELTEIDTIYILAFFIRRVFGYDYWRCTQEDDFGISLQVHFGTGFYIRSIPMTWFVQMGRIQILPRAIWIG